MFNAVRSDLHDLRSYSTSPILTLFCWHIHEPRAERAPSNSSHTFVSRHSSFQGFDVCITHAHHIASVGAVLGHHLTYEDSFLVYLPLAHAMEDIKEDISAFRPSNIMVSAPAKRFCLSQFGESNHECLFQLYYVCTPRFLRSSQIASFWRKWKLLLEADCWVGVLLLAVIPGIFDYCAGYRMMVLRVPSFRPS